MQTIALHIKKRVPEVSSDVPLLIRLGVGYSSGGEGLSSSIIIASSLEVSYETPSKFNGSPR